MCAVQRIYEGIEWPIKFLNNNCGTFVLVMLLQIWSIKKILKNIKSNRILKKYGNEKNNNDANDYTAELDIREAI